VPPRKKIQLSDDVREAFKGRLTHSKEIADRAEEDFHIEVFLMNKSGLTFEEIATQLNTRTSTVSDWKKKGEEAFGRRESARDQQPGEDPVRSGELEPLG
jgi:DNA-binding transcriptional regulator YiaG